MTGLGASMVEADNLQKEEEEKRVLKRESQ